MMRFSRSLFLLLTAVFALTVYGGETTEARLRPGIRVTPNGIRTPMYGMSRVRRGDDFGVSCARLSHSQIEAARFSRAVSRAVRNGSPRATIQAVRGGGSAFEIIYADAPGRGFNDAREGAARKRALEAAMNAWALVLDTTIPIYIEARMEAPESEEEEGLLASAGPTDFFEIEDFYVPAALAAQFVDDYVTEGADIEVMFNQDQDWDYATNGVAANGKASFVYVTIHEIGHGLGFIDSFDPDAGELGNDRPFPYDVFINRGSSRDNYLVDRVASRVQDDLISDDLFFNGESANIASRRSIRPQAMVKLFAPDPYEPGSSISHVDQDLYSDFKVGLMTPYDFGSGTNKIDVLTLGILKDIGYNLIPNATTAVFPATRSTLPKRLGALR